MIRPATFARIGVVAALALSTGACTPGDLLDQACQIGSQYGFDQACNIELPPLPDFGDFTGQLGL